MEIIDTYQAMTRANVGGKFYSQAVMRAHGVPIAEFFCLSRTLFDRVMAPVRPRIRDSLRDLEPGDRSAVRAAAQRIQELIRSREMDTATADAVLALYQERLGGAEFVSVRACMVCDNAEFSEDSATNPFAGISESFLYVRREQILERVKDCWASAFAEKAILYRLSQGIDLEDVSVAVGIQRMVLGARSFVMFTCDPNSAARDTLIVAGHGIGEGVVQETVPVDHYFINARSGEITSVLADKQSRLDLDRERGSGLRAYPVEQALRNAPCLSEAELRRLAVIGANIEAAFGGPQDIEGTFDEAGQVCILQARPIAIDYNTKRVWTGLNVTESYPGISSPLTYSLAKLFYREIFRDLYLKLGVSQEELNRNFAWLDRMIGYVRGRVYYCLNAFYLLHRQSPLFPKLAPAWEDMVGLKTSFAIQSGEAEAPQGKWGRRLSVAWAALKAGGMFLRHPRRMRQYKRWWIERARQSRALLAREQDALALTEEFYRLWRDVGSRWGVTLVNDAYIFTIYGLTQWLFKRWRLDRDPALLSNLLCGDDEVESVEIFLSILRIAEVARADDASRALFLESDDAQLVDLYRRRLLDPELALLLDAHIERYGDRSMEELKVENPSLREDPTVLFRGIRRFIKSELKVEDCRKAELAKRAEAEAALDARFGRFSLRKRVLRWVLAHLREVIAHRENSRYCRSELFGICKDIFRAQGAHLAERGAIDQPEDVFLLTIEEIFGFADGTGVDERFQDTVARRRAQLAEYAAEEIPDTLTTNGSLRANALALAPEAAEAGGELKGLGSSMGVARGRARVVLDPNGVDELPADTILVAKETDPGWLFLMLASSGMIVERGSMLSHTAITGRKFGIPTIVGVPAATSRIPNGAALEMNGGSGTVRLLDEEAA